jgi:hypothetical protein
MQAPKYGREGGSREKEREERDVAAGEREGLKCFRV